MTTTATPDEVWALLREVSQNQKALTISQNALFEAQKETDRQMQETARHQKETDRQMQETARHQKETDRQMKETDRQMKETDRELRALFAKTDRRIAEVSRKIGDLSSKWGEFVENQVAPGCETLFSSWGIPVHSVSQRVKKRLGADTLEIDVLVDNEQHVVLVEVKSTLKVEDVDDFLLDLAQFKRFAPKYAHKKVHGAVAAISFDGGVDRYAYQKGLFVLAQAGDNVAILNKKPFQPKSW